MTKLCTDFLATLIINHTFLFLARSGARGVGVDGIVREFGMDMYTLLYFKWVTNKDLLYSTENSAPCYMSAWMAGEFRGESIHVHVWPSPFAVYLKLPQCC